jgi:hypothetical protein
MTYKQTNIFFTIIISLIFAITIILSSCKESLSLSQGSSVESLNETQSVFKDTINSSINISKN